MTESEAESKLLEAVFGQQVQTKFDEQRLKQIRESELQRKKGRKSVSFEKIKKKAGF